MPVRAEDFEQTKAGTLRFYVWGRANYTTVLGIDYKFLGGRASNRLCKAAADTGLFAATSTTNIISVELLWLDERDAR